MMNLNLTQTELNPRNKSIKRMLCIRFDTGMGRIIEMTTTLLVVKAGEAARTSLTCMTAQLINNSRLSSYQKTH